MPKRAAPEPDPAWDKLTQREKFIQTAREHEADETGEAMERAFSRSFPPHKPGKTVTPYADREPAKGGRSKGEGK